MSYTLRNILDAMVRAGLDYRARVIKDFQPGQRATPRKIERIVDEAVASWDLGKDGRYTTESELEWCGYYIAACARRVGDFLEADRCVDVAIRRQLAAHGMGSTYRWQSEEEWAPYRPPAQIDPRDTQRGDTVIIGDDQPHGDHLCMARGSPTDGRIPTLEGNGKRVLLGDNTRGEGVGTRMRALDDVHSVRRLRLEHFHGEGIDR